jgi:hypothetical protein
METKDFIYTPAIVPAFAHHLLLPPSDRPFHYLPLHCRLFLTFLAHFT